MSSGLALSRRNELEWNSIRIFYYPHYAIYDEIAAPRGLQFAEDCLKLTAAAQFDVVQLQRLQWRRPIAITEIAVLEQRT